MSTVMTDDITMEEATEAPSAPQRPSKPLNPNEAYFIAAQTGEVTPNGCGIPGIAKTAQLMALARLTKRRIYILIGSLREPADIGGYPDQVTTTIVRNGKKEEIVYMALVPPKWAQDTYQYEEKWIVVCDELTSNSPAVQTALMGVVAEQRAGDLELAPDTWVLALCNPPEIAANGHELEPPMANRLYHHPWRPDWAAIREGWRNGFNYPEPDIMLLPDDWKERPTYDEAGVLIDAYYEVNPGAFLPLMDSNGKITSDREELCTAWPSPRSWHNFGQLLAADMALDAPEGTVGQHARGCIGSAVGDEFMQWKRNLNLPKPEPMLAEFIAAIKEGREPVYNHPDSPDKAIVFLSSIVAAVKNENTLDRWSAGMGVIEAAAKHEIDIAMIAGRKLISQDAMPDGAMLSDSFTEQMFPMLTRVIHHHE